MLVFIMMVAVACVDVSGGSIRCSVCLCLCFVPGEPSGQVEVCSCCGVRVTYNKGRPGGGDTVASIKAV